MNAATSLDRDPPHREYLTDSDVSALAVAQPPLKEELLTGGAGCREAPERDWFQRLRSELSRTEASNRRLCSFPTLTVPSIGELNEASNRTLCSFPTDRADPWIRKSVPKLLRLTKLPEDWDSYGAAPPPSDLVRAIVKVLEYSEVIDVPVPEVVPTVSGGVQLEWYMRDRQLEIEFPGAGAVEYLQTDLARSAEEEGRVEDLDTLRSLLLWIAEGE